MNLHTFIDPDDSSSGCAYVEDGQRCRRVKLSDAHSYNPAPPPVKLAERVDRPHVYQGGPDMLNRGPCIFPLGGGDVCGMQRLWPNHVSPLGLPPRERPSHLVAKHTVEHRHPGMDVPLVVIIDVVEAAIEQGAPPSTAVEWQRGGGGQRDDEPAYTIIRLTWEA